MVSLSIASSSASIASIASSVGEVRRSSTTGVDLDDEAIFRVLGTGRGGVCWTGAYSSDAAGDPGSTFSLLLVERFVGVSFRKASMTLGFALSTGEPGAGVSCSWTVCEVSTASSSTGSAIVSGS